MVFDLSINTKYLVQAHWCRTVRKASVYFVAFVSMCSFSVAHSHEYWLSPINYSISSGTKALIDIRNGEDFAGSAFPYEPEKYAVAYVVSEESREPVRSRLGDFPAIHPTLAEPGLYAVVVNSTRRELTYDNWDKFEQFLSYHGLLSFKEKHLSMSLPVSNIKEHYYRFAKTYVRVKADSESNKPTAENSITTSLKPQDQEFEIVFVKNPFDNSNSFEIKLLYQSRPLANRQVELFSKSSEITRTVQITDSEGIAKFDNVPRAIHLLNSVHLIEPNDPGAHWESLWASITLSTD